LARYLGLEHFELSTCL